LAEKLILFKDLVRRVENMDWVERVRSPLLMFFFLIFFECRTPPRPLSQPIKSLAGKLCRQWAIFTDKVFFIFIENRLFSKRIQQMDPSPKQSNRTIAEKFKIWAERKFIESLVLYSFPTIIVPVFPCYKHSQQFWFKNTLN
jgi:hypothetical protein